MAPPEFAELISAEAIHDRVQELGAQITADTGDTPLHVVAILHGALIFAADLIRAIDRSLTLDIVRLASYEGTESSGSVKFLVGPSTDLQGRCVLVVDDILDTGLTLRTATEAFREMGAARVSTCVLLDKPARRRYSMAADYVGFAIDDAFVVGYGLDLNGHYRNLPFVGVVKP